MQVSVAPIMASYHANLPTSTIPLVHQYFHVSSQLHSFDLLSFRCQGRLECGRSPHEGRPSGMYILWNGQVLPPPAEEMKVFTKHPYYIIQQ
jgi:hypothetical protein